MRIGRGVNAFFWLAVCAWSASASAVTIDELKSRGVKQLTGEEVRSVTEGNTIDQKMAGTRLVAPIFYRLDGTRVVNAKAFGARSYVTTKWWIDGDLRCENNARTGDKQCGVIFSEGDEYHLCFAEEEQCKWTFTVRAGNPDQLN